ncbi:CDP-glycerol glycerophosphotransferase family protein [Heyndrickxia vini]|uniref:CDP-glycerol glycerophosphotransferase family protein n=1 Tax=Heyndrickxia vini TaxID=1476025 RepID=A0ABX7E4V7_9BACI|nr:CDP-glycerol glycerophosphotransferase family protein [Heyndrickxia vini]QQZ10350.1 CDP-glycerol glycerophosphotransferase family protein [Heyndrickxia vini]
MGLLSMRTKLKQTDEKSRFNIQINKVGSKRNNLFLVGNLLTSHSVHSTSNVILKGRNSLKEMKIPVSLTSKKASANERLNTYIFRANIPFKSNDTEDLLEEDLYDLFLEITDRFQEKNLIRIGKPNFRAKYFAKELYVANQNDAIVINPYYTFKRYNLSIEVHRFPKDTFDYMKRLLFWAWILRPFHRKKDIWLVGERPYKAQDTGYHFFKYMRTQHPEKNVFYVIDKNSPEMKNIEELGNVLTFKSKEHIWHTIMSTRIISSHHPDYLYPTRTKKFKNTVRATKVFLQHGIMGTKNMIENYGKGIYGFDTDLFLVSSDFEKNMIINDFGYSANHVFITGLSRFDELFKKDTTVKRQLLIIPTWRDWISSKSNFLDTEYYKKYDELIFNDNLHRIAKKYQLNIVFCLHPNMQKYTPYFKNAPVKVISQGEVNVQTLLKESAIMITDYSSVAFDFSFLSKPIIYYQFDRDKFIGKRPSHIDLDKDLPGDIVFELESLFAHLDMYGQNNFQIKQENMIKSNKFLKYQDLHSNKRIFNVINHNYIRHTWFTNLLQNQLIKKIFSKIFRK